MRERISIGLKWCIFIMIVFVIMSKISPFFSNEKETDFNLEAFQHMKDEPDVLAFGSSMMLTSFIPDEIYQEYGITAYNLGAPSQRLDSSYLFLKSILKNRNPKVVLIVTDYINEITKPTKTLNEETITIRGIQGNEKEKWEYLYSHLGLKPIEYLKYKFPVLQFHKDLLDGNIRKKNSNDKWNRLYYKGYYFQEGEVQANIPLICKQEELSKEAIEYTRKIVDLCHEKNIEVVFVAVPVSNEFPYGDSIKKNFSDCGFVDMYENFKETEIDANKDYYHITHLNIQGARKATKFIGKYLVDHYELEDHRKKHENNIWDITLKTDKEMDFEKYDKDIWKHELEKADYQFK